MISSKVAKRYAQALLELAAEQGQLEAWGAELERLAQVISSPELIARLSSPELARPDAPGGGDAGGLASGPELSAAILCGGGRAAWPDHVDDGDFASLPGPP